MLNAPPLATEALCTAAARCRVKQIQRNTFLEGKQKPFLSGPVSASQIKNRRGEPLRYREPACKPGSVPLRAAVIHPGRRLPDGSSNLPGSDWPGRPAPLFGLASNGVCLARRVTTTTGGLLLHPFTLTSTAQGRLAVCFLLRFPEIALSGRYPAFCPMKPGLSSPRQDREAPRAATARPAPEMRFACWQSPSQARCRRRSEA